MDAFRVAVKSFIVNKDNEILLIRRRDNDPHKPGVWEVPGGRLELGENPFEGLKRETLEEVGIDIKILNPLKIHHFTRDDGQKITMITFLCKPDSNSVSISNEHTHHEWVHLDKAKSKICPCFQEDISIIRKHFIKA
jgi:8-oxo-dGTP diphosphatase